jgi:adenylate kinase
VQLCAQRVPALQAQKLDAMFILQKELLDSVVELTIADQLLISHTTSHLIHPSSGRTYHSKFKCIE